MPAACCRRCAPICPISTPPRAGDLAPATGWLREKVQRHGGLLTPREVIARPAASPDEGPLLDYLEAKFKSLLALGIGDLIVTAVAIGTAGALFWGSGVEFRLLGIAMNWLAFSLTTLVAMGLPLFFWFTRRHGIGHDGDN
jgi:hypothetical protein